MFFRAILSFIIVSAFICANAETHTVHFINNCGFGTPTLIQGTTVLSTGEDFVSNGSLISAIAYLQIGVCGFNGEGCTTVETTLINPTFPGTGSSTDISLIPPFSFSKGTGFFYFDGCDGEGADCTDIDCPTADTLQIACQVANVSLAVTFCD